MTPAKISGDMSTLQTLVNEISACQICSGELPLKPRPVLQVDQRARILVAAQAPGRKVHETGIPFNDPSGDRLRDWMGIPPATFYDPSKIAIVPMGFCYPGSGKTGDRPPRPECAAAWRVELLGKLPDLQFTLVIGQYAAAYHLRSIHMSTLTETIKAWRNYWPTIVPLPHPSPRNQIWLRKNPWFSRDILPALRKRIQEVLRA